MAGYDYNDRYFVSAGNTENGEAFGETVFHYRQRDALIRAIHE